MCVLHRYRCGSNWSCRFLNRCVHLNHLREVEHGVDVVVVDLGEVGLVIPFLLPALARPVAFLAAIATFVALHAVGRV